MKDRRNIKYLVIGISIMLITVIGVTFAFFGANKLVSNTLPVNITIAEGIEANFTVTGDNNISLTIAGSSMLHDLANNVAANNTVTLNVSLESSDDVECTYDIVWQWNANTPNQYTKTTGATKEFTISGSDGTQNLTEVQLPNYSTSTTTLGTYSIVTQNSITIQNWSFDAKFYNLNLNQDAHADKTYAGKIAIANANCGPVVPPTAAEEIADLAGTTGTDGSGNPWGVVEDHGIRYVGQNPSNFVWFNCSNLTNQSENTCERWRIIGVFNETYDTNNDGIPDTQGDLIKIIRNDSLGSFMWDCKQIGVGSSSNSGGSNDWSDSQLMMMLNPTTFLNSGYVTENDASPVHSNTIDGEGYVLSDQQTPIRIYRNMGSYFDSSLTAYKPAGTSTSGFTATMQADTSTFKRMNTASQSMIATVKWHLTGASSFYSSSNGLASHFYNYERNNPDGTGLVYTGAGTRPKIWYGKVGLMYPSDYGYATSGNPNDATYNREGCLNKELYNWDSGSYRTYCAYNSWLMYYNTTGSSVGQTSNVQWTITPYSPDASRLFIIHSNGFVDGYDANNTLVVRSVLYLESGVSITGGEGTYNSPYVLAQ